VRECPPTRGYAGGVAKYACPCCGYLTLDQEAPGTFAMCEVCMWEDDPVQFDDPDFGGGANRPSLNEARENFKRLQASDARFVEQTRPPRATEIPPS
jgi:hypothetical protein